MIWKIPLFKIYWDEEDVRSVLVSDDGHFEEIEGLKVLKVSELGEYD